MSQWNLFSLQCTGLSPWPVSCPLCKPNNGYSTVSAHHPQELLHSVKQGQSFGQGACPKGLCWQSCFPSPRPKILALETRARWWYWLKSKWKPSSFLWSLRLGSWFSVTSTSGLQDRPVMFRVSDCTWNRYVPFFSLHLSLQRRICKTSYGFTNIRTSSPAGFSSPMLLQSLCWNSLLRPVKCLDLCSHNKSISLLS